MTQATSWGESLLRNWRVEPCSVLVDALTAASRRPSGRPVVWAVDGSSGGGKTTLAEQLRASVPGSTVVHTDDIAWWHSEFDWVDLMVSGVLQPLHRGQPVSYRPPAWEQRSRPGSVEVSADAPLVIVEGVGASRRELTALLDATVWVQSDPAEAERRGIARDGGDAAAEAEWRDWMSHEVPFLTEDRPWERATVIVSGTPTLAHNPITEVVLARPTGPPTAPSNAQR